MLKKHFAGGGNHQPESHIGGCFAQHIGRITNGNAQPCSLWYVNIIIANRKLSNDTEVTALAEKVPIEFIGAKRKQCIRFAAAADQFRLGHGAIAFPHGNFKSCFGEHFFCKGGDDTGDQYFFGHSSKVGHSLHEPGRNRAAVEEGLLKLNRINWVLDATEPYIYCR